MICFKVTYKHQYSECKGTSSPIINPTYYLPIIPIFVQCM